MAHKPKINAQLPCQDANLPYCPCFARMPSSPLFPSLFPASFPFLSLFCPVFPISFSPSFVETMAYETSVLSGMEMVSALFKVVCSSKPCRPRSRIGTGVQNHLHRLSRNRRTRIARTVFSGTTTETRTGHLKLVFRRASSQDNPSPKEPSKQKPETLKWYHLGTPRPVFTPMCV